MQHWVRKLQPVMPGQPLTLSVRQLWPLWVVLPSSSFLSLTQIVILLYHFVPEQILSSHKFSYCTYFRTFAVKKCKLTSTWNMFLTRKEISFDAILFWGPSKCKFSLYQPYQFQVKSTKMGTNTVQIICDFTSSMRLHWSWWDQGGDLQINHLAGKPLRTWLEFQWTRWATDQEQRTIPKNGIPEYPQFHPQSISPSLQTPKSSSISPITHIQTPMPANQQ